MGHRVSMLQLSEVRAQMASALAPTDDGDPEVIADIVDAVTPPALLLLWGDPWLDPKTVGMSNNGHGYWEARLEVLCIAARIEPGPGVAKLEELAAYVITRLNEDTNNVWPRDTFFAPRDFVINGIHYLGARLVYRVPVTL